MLAIAVLDQNMLVWFLKDETNVNRLVNVAGHS